MAVALLGTNVAHANELLPVLAKTPPAYAFELKDLDGRQHRLSDYAERPIVVNFWATWCGPCRAEMPSLARAADVLETEGITVLGINVGDDPEQIQRFLRETPIGFALLQDDTQETVRNMPVLGLPTTLLINGAGQITHRVTGEREWDSPQMLREIRAAAQ